ncbi:hypothetical protein [Streptomyces sp. Da 82-17]|uniref:hypothetical protein n=1 Tax=Streptomyces sp. Da 82-17 TaxID=3377116 RepID=UPI0038D4EDA9
MNDSFTAHIGSEHGAFHTGSGSQYVFQNIQQSVRQQHVQPLADSHLKWLAARFAPPSGLAHARQILDSTGTVLLEGKPGYGRNAAARMLLYEYRELRGNFREVLTEDDSGNPLIDAGQAGQVDDGEGLLLDLSQASQDALPQLLKQLSGYHASVSRRGSRLAVILPHADRLDLHGPLGSHRAAIGRPDAEYALRLILKQDRVPEGLPTPLPEQVRNFLHASPPMRDIGEFARLISVAQRDDPNAGVAAWCDRALSPFTLSTARVAQHVIGLQGGRPRALLLATAMLDGARSDAVYDACETLLDTVEFPPDDRPLLEREDLSARFSQIEATPGPDSRVTFREFGYAQAVRTHFWNNMPGLRRELGTWVGETLPLRTLSEEDRLGLADRFTEQSLRTGGVEDLIRHVCVWTDQKGPETWAAAARALTDGALHDEAGPRVRRELYAWATASRELRKGRSHVLLDVCTGPFGERYPEQALVRLHHLARNPAGGKEVEEQVAALATRSHHLHRFMLARLSEGLQAYDHPADLRLFLGLSRLGPLLDARDRPRPLFDERTVREHLTSGWRALYDRASREELSLHTDHWLSAADRAASRRRTQLLDVLVQACRKRPWACGLLYHVARRHAVADVVLQKVDAIQGLTVA